EEGKKEIEPFPKETSAGDELQETPGSLLNRLSASVAPPMIKENETSDNEPQGDTNKSIK
ncbi:MAG: hypothetical protein AB1546_02155, partial [bacterium]